MYTYMSYLVFSLLALIVIWTLWGFFGSRVEQMDYRVVTQLSDYEIREYPEHIVAQTTVSGTSQTSMGGGFGIVAGYIFGGNTKNESISMTAPVISTTDGDSQTISFGMPKSYSLETLPKPNDSRVKIVTIPTKKYAVIAFA